MTLRDAAEALIAQARQECPDDPLWPLALRCAYAEWGRSAGFQRLDPPMPVREPKARPPDSL